VRIASAAEPTVGFGDFVANYTIGHDLSAFSFAASREPMPLPKVGRDGDGLVLRLSLEGDAFAIAAHEQAPHEAGRHFVLTVAADDHVVRTK